MESGQFSALKSLFHPLPNIRIRYLATITWFKGRITVGSSAIDKEHLLDERSEIFSKSPNEDVTEGKVRETLDESKNDQPDLFVKPTNSNVAKTILVKHKK